MMLVMVSLIAVFLGLQSSSFDNFVRMYSSESVGTAAEGKTDTRVAVGNTGLVDVLNQTMSGNTEEGRQLSEAHNFSESQ